MIAYQPRPVLARRGRFGQAFRENSQSPSSNLKRARHCFPVDPFGCARDDGNPFLATMLADSACELTILFRPGARPNHSDPTSIEQRFLANTLEQRRTSLAQIRFQ